MGAQQTFRQLGVAIDDLLVASHGLGAGLKDDHVPFSANMAEAYAKYGGGPVFHLWNTMRMIHRLNEAWTGVPPP